MVDVIVRVCLRRDMQFNVPYEFDDPVCEQGGALGSLGYFLELEEEIFARLMG